MEENFWDIYNDISEKKEIKDKKIDTFIGNAGILSYKNIDNFSHQDAHQIFDVNLLGHLKLIQNLKNNIAQSDSKKIILLSSMAKFITFMNYEKN